MQPIRITYNQTCELLSIKRYALRLLVQQDQSFPRPIKYGTAPQSPIYWHGMKNENSKYYTTPI
jgi:hypothetical protein